MKNITLIALIFSYLYALIFSKKFPTINVENKNNQGAKSGSYAFGSSSKGGNTNVISSSVSQNYNSVNNISNSKNVGNGNESYYNNAAGIVQK